MTAWEAAHKTISPIVGNKPINGPASKFMQAKGFAVSPYGVFKCYEDFLDVLIIDEGDECTVEDKEGAVLKTGIIIKNERGCEKIAMFLKKFVESKNRKLYIPPACYLSKGCKK